jgi:hypothetical protein
MTAAAVGSDDGMSTLYERWRPSVGDRVRVVMRDETGAATESGKMGTIVAVHPGAPHELCEVEYDSQAGIGSEDRRQTHAASELEPITEAPTRVADAIRGRLGPSSAGGGGAAWQPTVGDRVALAGGNRTGTITAIDERGDDTVCEVEYDHLPGETSQPQRGSHPIRELTPTREPSAEA